MSQVELKFPKVLAPPGLEKAKSVLAPHCKVCVILYIILMMTRIKYKEAIGLEVKRGRPSSAKKPSKEVIEKLYAKESRSIREIAEQLRCSKDIVYRSLKEYGIEMRPRFNRSKLRKYKLFVLERGVKEKGVRGYAKELGVHENTLRYYLKKARKGS
ncbi:MAG: hypothetical protein ACFFDN_16025 [Candidatus Hodarchaeota archaeon]